jgi:glycosyltransferase involved in cell wall biosynthesis
LLRKSLTTNGINLGELMMRLQRIVFLLFALWSYLSSMHAHIPEKNIVVVIPSYNNSQWYERNLDSVFMQEYDNYHVIYLDDVSPDSTADLVEQYLASRGIAQRCTLIKNTTRVGALLNLYRAIHACPDDSIIVTLDGDDWFKHAHVLQVINGTYNTEDVWLTYGQYEGYPNGRIGMCRNYPDDIKNGSHYREYDWITSHLRTFYAGLFKRINMADLIYNNTLFPVTWDLAMMFPMLEMAAGRIKYIPQVLYVYNIQTPLNDYKLRFFEQMHCEYIIRAKNKYQPLNSLNQPSYEQQQHVDIIIITRDQHGTIAPAMDLFEDIGAIHTIADKDNVPFSERFSDLLGTITTPYVLILQDYYQPIYRCSLAGMATLLAQTKAHCFSLAMDPSSDKNKQIRGTIHTPPLISLMHDIVAWQFKQGEFQWRQPYHIDATLYATHNLQLIAANVQAPTCKDFISIINQRIFDLSAIGLCYTHPVVKIID